jgi:hypothetical protein
MAVKIIDNIKFTDVKENSEISGWVFATKKLFKWFILAVLDWQQISIDYYNSLSEKEKSIYEINILSEDTLLVRAIKTKYWLLNHSTTPNCQVIKEGVVLSLKVIENIDEWEELTIDYRNHNLPNEIQ